MAGAFDSEFEKEFSIAPEEEPQANAAMDQFVDELADDSIDEDMLEAERRFAKAAYYRVISKDGAVEDDGSVEAREVNAEIRLWAKQQTRKLLGVGPQQQPAAVGQFTDKEAAGLKKLLELMLARGVVKDDGAPAPVAKKVAAPAAPSVRKVQSQSQPAPKPAPRRQPEKQPAGKKKPPKVHATAAGNIDYNRIPDEEAFEDVDGQVYKFVANASYDPSDKNSKPRIKMKITTQVKTPQALPMPSSKQAWEQISYQQSAEAVNMGVSASASMAGGEGAAGQQHFITAAALAQRNNE